MTERWLATVGGRLRALRAVERAGAAATARAHAFPRSPTEVVAGQAARERWRACYDEVRRRHAAGETLMHIADVLGLARSTVRRFAQAQAFPEGGARPVPASGLDSFLPHLSARHAAGCENGLQLWRELRALGYTGHSRQVHRWLQTRRRVPAPTHPTSRRRGAREVAPRTPPPRPSLPSPRQLAWLLGLPPTELAPGDAAVVARVAQDADAARVIALVRRFVALVRNRAASGPAADTVDAWLEEASGCGIRAVETFAAGLRQDGAAVRAAFTTARSNAQSEGHVTKLKLLKRQMYGRANVDLLRRRALLAA